MTQARRNWLDNLNWQIEFYDRAAMRNREDPEFEWGWLDKASRSDMGELLREVAKKAWRGLPQASTRPKGTSAYSQTWLQENAGLLWGARTALEDDLSKLLFDSHLVLKATGHRKHYYPRIDFDDFVDLVGEKPFVSDDLPRDYLGLPLHVFDVRINGHEDAPQLKMVTTKVQLSLLNSYRQYLVKRNGVEMGPARGDVVFDCGACIGEVALLFAALVGNQGQVHMFDPVPLHARYCALQAAWNPTLSGILHMNSVAVGDVSRTVAGAVTNSDHIAPGGLAVDAFDVTSLDDYVANNGVKRVDVIKLDVEGHEMATLRGASRLIREQKPRLAISTYHKPEDLWEIPDYVHTLNSGYRMFFGHHSPMAYESVYYAKN